MRDKETLRLIDIRHSSEPVLIVVPGDTPDDQSMERSCIFWNESSHQWSSEGLNTTNTTGFDPARGGRLRCASSHLTAFSSKLGFKAEINTFEESDVTYNAFHPLENSAMAVVVLLACAFLCLVPFTHILDSRKKSSCSTGSVVTPVVAAVNGSHLFWREFNQIKKLKWTGNRTWANWWKGTLWATRRNHPWISVVARHPFDYIDARKRLAMLMAHVFQSAAVVSLLSDTEQHYLFVSGPLAQAMTAVIVGYPVPFVISIFLSRPAPTYLRLRKSEEASWFAEHLPFLFFITSLITANVETCIELNLDNEDDGGDEDDVAAREDGEDDSDDDNDNDNDYDKKDEDKAEGRRRSQNPPRFSSSHAALLVGANVAAAGAQKHGESKGSAWKEENEAKRTHNGAPTVKRMASRKDSLRPNVLRCDTHALQLRRSAAFKKVPRICGFPTLSANLPNDIWGIQDVIALGFIAFACLGCAFLVVVLAWARGNKEANSHVLPVTALSFIQDAVFRVSVIMFIQLILFMPTCFLSTNDPDRVQKLDAKDTVKSGGSKGTVFVRIPSDTPTMTVSTNCSVKHVYPHGLKLGIVKGWLVQRINNVVIESHCDARVAIAEALALDDEYVVEFETHLMSTSSMDKRRFSVDEMSARKVVSLSDSDFQGKFTIEDAKRASRVSLAKFLNLPLSQLSVSSICESSDATEPGWNS